MDDFSKKLFRNLNGKPYDEAIRTPKLSDLTGKFEQELFSHFPEQLIYLGHSQEKDIYLTQEDLDAHCHILGATRQGKSKLLEIFIRANIDYGYGCCLIDGSENGDTANNVLKYCASKNFKKVLLVSPSDFLEYKRIPNLNPFKYAPPNASPYYQNILANRSVGMVFDTLKTTWNFQAESITRLEKYVPAVLHPLYWSQNTLSESKFLVEQLGYGSQKEALLSQLPKQHQDLGKHLMFAWKNVQTYKDFQSTVNQFNIFLDPILSLLVGSKQKQIRWKNLIANGWLILVNLDTTDVWADEIPQRILGTLVINEIFYAVQSLTKNKKKPWSGRFRLYIDECQDYATRKIPVILNKKSKLGLKLTLSHHYPNQDGLKEIYPAIENNALMKFMFFMAKEKDRLDSMKNMGYGGELPDRPVAYELRQLEAREATFTPGKPSPVKILIREVEDPPVSEPEVQAFKKLLYSNDFLYQDENIINNEINARFETKTQQPRTKGRRISDSQGGNLESNASKPVLDGQTTGSDSRPQKRQSYFSTALPKDLHIPSGVRRRGQGTPEDGRGRTGKKTQAKK